MLSTSDRWLQGDHATARPIRRTRSRDVRPLAGEAAQLAGVAMRARSPSGVRRPRTAGQRPPTGPASGCRERSPICDSDCARRALMVATPSGFTETGMTTTARPIDPAPDPRRRPLYRAVWRWHFYAGLLVIPIQHGHDNLQEPNAGTPGWGRSGSGRPLPDSSHPPSVGEWMPPPPDRGGQPPQQAQSGHLQHVDGLAGGQGAPGNHVQTGRDQEADDQGGNHGSSPAARA